MQGESTQVSNLAIKVLEFVCGRKGRVYCADVLREVLLDARVVERAIRSLVLAKYVKQGVDENGDSYLVACRDEDSATTEEV